MSRSNRSTGSFVLKGGASSDMFSYSSCQNNPGSYGTPNYGTWDSLGCDIGNVFTGIGHTFENGIGAIGNMLDLGEIVVNE
jgi:hypothetical protein